MKKQIIFLCLLVHLGYSQTKIKLISPQGRYDYYRLENTSDTTFVEITHKEDMGVRYGQSYRLKVNAPDGEYEIYVDNNIELSAFLLNHKKIGKWKTFYNNGKLKSVEKYKDGELNVNKIEYYRTGIISYIGKFVNNKATSIGTAYYESGKVKAINYFLNGEHFKQEVFYENGKLKLTYDPRTGMITKNY